MPKRTRSYKAGQLQRLKDPSYAAEYINAAIEAGDDAAFLLALRNVAEAQSMNMVANQAGLSRESVYRMLSESGNPCYTSLKGILDALGLEFRIQSASKPASDGCSYSSWNVSAPLVWYTDDWKSSTLVWELNDRPRNYLSHDFCAPFSGLRQLENHKAGPKSAEVEPAAETPESLAIAA